MGDIIPWIPGRYWGGTLNGVAIIAFLLITVLSILFAKNAKD